MATKEQIETENARVKYQAVLSLKTSEGEIQWNRYNAMILVNTILLASVPYSYNPNWSDFFKILFWLVPFLGLLLCHAWYKMTKRGFMWTSFWIGKANEIEMKQLNGLINPVKNGEDFMNSTGDVGVTKKLSLGIIKVFSAIYFIISLYNILYISNLLHIGLP